MLSPLTQAGVSKGTTVAIYLPMIPEILVAMYACARIGAPHSIVVGALLTRVAIHHAS